MSPKSIDAILHEISTLLQKEGEVAWADVFRYIQEEYERAPLEGLASISRLYGGMGSFSDLVLQDSQGVSAANDRLNELRQKLYVAKQVAQGQAL